MALWCSGYHYDTTSFKKVWTQVLHRFKSYLWLCFRDYHWWESLTVVPAGNKTYYLSTINRHQSLFSFTYFSHFYWYPALYFMPNHNRVVLSAYAGFLLRGTPLCHKCYQLPRIIKVCKVLHTSVSYTYNPTDLPFKKFKNIFYKEK